jgi:pimeloyl-ACP methyl ester carboxylesterase
MTFMNLKSQDSHYEGLTMKHTMKKVIFLHGNAGTSGDGDPLHEYLIHTNVNLSTYIAPDLYESADLASLLSDGGWTVIAHSWGCYFLFSQLEANPHLVKQIERIILVAPYLKQERPLSALAQFLLKLPLVGRLILQANHTKSKDAFLTSMLAPTAISDLPYARQLQHQLADFELWALAAKNKLAQQINPITKVETLQVPILAMVGDHDQVCNNELQISFLKILAPHAVIRHVTNAGHGLIWTHLAELAQEI